MNFNLKDASCKWTMDLGLYNIYTNKVGSKKSTYKLDKK